MINFIKKHKLNFISYFLCAFAMALFTIISFSCKTYAYSIDSNGNLVGDNIFNADTMITSRSNVVYSSNSQLLTIQTQNNDPYIFINNLNGINGTRYYVQIFGVEDTTVDMWDSTNGRLGSNFIYNSNEVYHIEFEGYMASNIGTYNLYISVCTYELEQWEPYGVWYSSSNYDTLENQLNTTNGLLDLQIDITKYGWLSYIDNLEYYVTGNYVSTFTFEQLKTNNYISNNATLDLYTMSLYQNPNYSYIKFDIYFQNSYANLDYFSANLFDISTKLGFNGVVSIYDTDSNSAVFNITDIASITYEDIIEKNSNFGDYIYNVVFEFASPDASTMIYTNSFYSRGYQTGYSYGSNVTTGYYTPIINDLNARISNLENDIVSLNNTIDTLKELNAQYQQQLADNVGWSSLFFAFADTPFKVVSNVLGFELFGLNLFATFIGMITVFGVVYLLKKFL